MEQFDGKDMLIRELKGDIHKLNEEIQKLNEENANIRNENQFLQYRLDEICKSFSYRIGLKLTAIPRKLKSNKNQEDK